MRFANAGGSFINLRFNVDTDMQKTLIDVISRMNQLQALPRDANPPVITLGEDGGGGANQTLSWFFVQLLPGTPGPIDSYQKYLEDVVKPRIESVPGVALVNINAGAPEELQIRFDPYRAAELGIEIPALATFAGTANDTSGGYVELGRRQYSLRFAGRYTPQELGEQILAWRDQGPVRLKDIAEIEIRRGDRENLAMQNGNPAMGLQIIKESGANVLATLNAVKAEIATLREGPLKEMGLGIEQSFDPSLFINQRHQPRFEQPLRGRIARTRRAVVIPPAHARRAPSRSHRADLPALDLHHARAHRPHAQRDLAGGPRVWRRHGARRRHHRARERPAAAGARRIAAGSSQPGNAAGLAGAGGLHHHHGGDLSAGAVAQGRRGTVVRGSRAHHLDRERDLDDRGRDRGAGRGSSLGQSAAAQGREHGGH